MGPNTNRSQPQRGSSHHSGIPPGGGSGAHVQVAVRVRPSNEKENSGVFSKVVEVMDKNMLVFDPCQRSSPRYLRGKKLAGRDFTKRKNKDLKFVFDRVFHPGVSNHEVYENTTKKALGGLLNGYNCSVFAYGATGAGKTHTMLGKEGNPGIVFLTMMDLYQRIDALKAERSCDIAVSYLEVYNERVRDLLLKGRDLPVREDPGKGALVVGLSVHKPRSAEELVHILEFGNKNRTQHPTDGNAESSRSHAIFQVFVRERERTAGLSTNVKVAKMSLIDLAGSERASASTNRGLRFREGANINKSLLALGSCINALASGKGKKYIPYRDSKLTRILKDSLGGNCCTVMIAAVSPSSASYDDTYNTLQYANRAKNIKADVSQNVMSVNVHVSQYAKIVEELRQEVAELKGKLSQCTVETVVKPAVKLLPSPCNINRITDSLASIFQQRIGLRKEYLALESSHRDLSFKIEQKNRQIQRIQAFISDNSLQQKRVTKLQNWVKSATTKQHQLLARSGSATTQLTNNDRSLQAVMEDVRKERDGEIPEAVDLSLKCHRLEVSLGDRNKHVQHLQRLCKAQSREMQSSERILLKVLLIAKKQFYTLKGHGLVTSELQGQYDEALGQVLDDRDVTWADESVSCDTNDTQLDISVLTDLPLIPCSIPDVSSAVAETPNHKGRTGFSAEINTTFTAESVTKSILKQTPRHNATFTAESVTKSILKQTPCRNTTFTADSSVGNLSTCGKVDFQVAPPVQSRQIDLSVSVKDSQVHSTAVSNRNVTFSELPDTRGRDSVHKPSSDSDSVFKSPRGSDSNLKCNSLKRGISEQVSSHDSTYVLSTVPSTNTRPSEKAQDRDKENELQRRDAADSAESACLRKAVRLPLQDMNNDNVRQACTSTVTKDIASIIVTHDNSTVFKKPVARSINFDKLPGPSPSVPKTVPEVLLSQDLLQNVGRLPMEGSLISSSNLPGKTNSSKNDASRKRLLNTADNSEANEIPRKRHMKRHHSVASTKDILIRNGIPVASSEAGKESETLSGSGRPSYMQPTKSTLRRVREKRLFSVSQQSDGRIIGPVVTRVLVDQDSAPPRKSSRGLSRSKSFNWIKKSTFF